MGLMLIYVPRYGLAASGSAGAGAPRARPGSAGHGPEEQRLVEEPLPVCPGTARRETAALHETRPRSSGDHEGEINSAAGEGPRVLPGGLAAGRRGQKAEIWDRFPRASM